MDNVKKAIEAQRKRRADIQSAYDSRKKSAIEARRGIISPKKTNPTAPIKSTSKPSGYESYMNTVKGESFKVSAPKKPVAKGPTTAQKRAAFSAANTPIQSKAVKPSASGIGVASLSKAAPKAINVAPKRTYSEKEQKINAILATGKKKNGTMKASAQRKIQRIRRK